ncbi:hypothetical protein DQG23_22915 [Paenibacillus contaminans]|uniref:Uncharacterized protein n=1 Tax=Paenibacillus contaminans TaxID=450362 RepID=A0A329MGS6_9BACL|nr:hypothetical protein DQG23_22915 [Paenibacillus contaminans]
MQQGIEVRLTLESDFAGLESGFTGVPNKLPAASRRFRTTSEERKPYSIPSGQSRTAAHASDKRGWIGVEPERCKLIEGKLCRKVPAVFPLFTFAFLFLQSPRKPLGCAVKK